MITLLSLSHEDLPDVAENDTADQVRHEKNGTEQPGSMEFFTESQCYKECEYIYRDDTYDRKKCRVPQRMSEVAFVKHRHIVFKTDEVQIIYDCKFIKGEIHSPDERDYKSDEKCSHCRQHEQRKRPSYCSFHLSCLTF